MPLTKHLIVFYICLVFSVSDQLVLPDLPDLPDLPTPETFLETLFNVTATGLAELVDSFTFEEVLSEDVTFFLYKPDGNMIPLNLNSDKYHVDIEQPMKFVIHGWQSTGEQDFIKEFAKSYHALGIHNVFGVDWSEYSHKNYVQSARSVKKVGEIVAQFVMNIVKNNTKLLKDVHLIGHSLGAQVSGFAGQHIQTLTNGVKIGRITGLDAAGPLFEIPFPVPSNQKITQDDADYVDGIHTNAGFLGVLTPFANADYYVDFGGPIQPGCLDVNIFEAFTCSHGKAHTIYNKTITTKKYVATSCNNPIWALINLCDDNQKVVMGEHTSMNARGEFYINVDEDVLPKKNKRGILGVIDKLPGFN